MSNNSKLEFVDSARGIAILLVILVHTAQQIPSLHWTIKGLAYYGQMGVQLFFVVSAYTLCLTFERRSNEKLAITSFYLRRFFRIAPLYYFAIAIYFLVHFLGLAPTLGPYSISNIAANLLFIHGFVPTEANNAIVPGGWSIGTEMAFYVCFPLFYKISKQMIQWRLSILWILLLLLVFINICTQLVIAGVTGYAIQNNNFLYYNIVNQMPVFAVGMIAYFLHQRCCTNSLILSRSLSISGFLIFTLFALIIWKLKVNVFFAIVPAVSAVSFLFLLNCLKTFKRQNALICKIGKISFSMYIFHFLLLLGFLPFLVTHLSGALDPIILLLFAYLLMSGFTTIIALVTERSIEARGIIVGAALISWLQRRDEVTGKLADVKKV